jgi:hypothetical protein
MVFAQKPFNQPAFSAKTAIIKPTFRKLHIMFALAKSA